MKTLESAFKIATTVTTDLQQSSYNKHWEERGSEQASVVWSRRGNRTAELENKNFYFLTSDCFIRPVIHKRVRNRTEPLILTVHHILMNISGRPGLSCESFVDPDRLWSALRG